MKKLFIPYDQLRNDALKLAAKIYKDGFIPDVIYLPLRGGAYMGNVFSEFFKIVLKESRPVFYAAVVARSYTNIREQSDVMIDGWTYDPQYLRNGDKILFVDDIFDSGRTLNYLVDVIIQRGLPRQDIKVAVHDYKDIQYKERDFPIIPDYYSQRHDVKSPQDEVWIHYLSHELIGMTKEEVKEHFPVDKDEELAEAFRLLNKLD
ncbi:MAG: phosphoribosyltransferase [Spirochaetaceae bacterium]|jgi:hypoxanthine phosphoribosyltransferase|nr:phosphoribosyltransferase [Spirochaetaceae bacterium]